MEEDDVDNMENMIDDLLARTDAAIGRFYAVDNPDNLVAVERRLVENNSGQDEDVENSAMEDMSEQDVPLGEDFDFPTHDYDVENSAMEDMSEQDVPLGEDFDFPTHDDDVVNVGVGSEVGRHSDRSAGTDAEEDRHTGGDAPEDHEADVNVGGAEAEEDPHAEVDVTADADVGANFVVDVKEILREVAGSNILFVRVDGLMGEHIRRGGYHTRTNLTHFFEVPCCYDFSLAPLTEWDTETDALSFTDSARWLHRRRLHEMSPSDFADALIHKFGFTTRSAKLRAFGLRRKLEQSGFPMRECLLRLEHIIMNLPDGMLAHLEAEQNVRNCLSDENIRSVWHAAGTEYVGHRSARSEMIELVNDRGDMERIFRSFSESVRILTRKYGGRILTTAENDRLVQQFTSRVQEEHRRVRAEKHRLWAQQREQERQLRHHRVLARVAALNTETERENATREFQRRERRNEIDRRQRAEYRELVQAARRYRGEAQQ